MSGISRRVFWWSVAAHTGIILSLVLFPLIMNCRMRKKPAEIITYVDLQTLTVPPPEPAPETPVAEPEKPPPPEPPKDIPEPEPVKKKKIEVSKKKIKREEMPPPREKPKLTPEEIKKLLAEGAKISSEPVPDLALPAWYFALVRQTMYDHWNQPGELAGAVGMMTRMQFRISRDGSISRVRMIRSSGSKVMDDSVMAAINSVSRLKELPPSYPEPFYDAIVDFELTQGGF